MPRIHPGLGGGRRRALTPPGFCNTVEEQPIAAFDRDPALPLSRRYKCTACRERSQQLRPRSDPRQLAGVQSDALLLASEVLELAEISRSEIYRRIRTGTFPPPVRLGVQRVAWRQNRRAALDGRAPAPRTVVARRSSIKRGAAAPGLAGLVIADVNIVPRGSRNC